MCIGSPTRRELTISKFVLVGFSSVVAFLFMWASVQYILVMRRFAVQYKLWLWRLRCFFEIDAWPRSFVVIGFLVGHEKVDDLSSRGTLSTGLCPHGTNEFRCGLSSATETIVITSRRLQGSKFENCLRCAARGSNTWRSASWRRSIQHLIVHMQATTGRKRRVPGAVVRWRPPLVREMINVFLGLRVLGERSRFVSQYLRCF